MGSMNPFKSPKSPKIPVQEVIEPIAVVEETAEDARRREKKKLSRKTGRQGTIISGIQSALKKRLGE